MIARILDNQFIHLDQISPYEEQVVWDSFSVAKPGIQYVDLSDSSYRWDGVYRFYNRAKRRLARPLLSVLRKVCQEHNLPLQVRDHREPAEYPAMDPADIRPDGFLPGIVLDPWQLRAIHAACRAECGIIDMPTGSGKGEIIAGICKAVPCPTVILADQTVVIDQLKARLELRDVAEQVGMFYAGRRPNGELVVVGSIQSLCPPGRVPQPPARSGKDTDAAWRRKLNNYDQRMRAYKTRVKNAKYLRNTVRQAHMILVDECDKCSSAQYRDVFRNVFRGRRRFGFSGTPFEPTKPVENFFVRSHLGDVIARERRSVVEAAGRIIPVEYFALVLDGDPHEASTYDIAYRERITENPRFWQLVSGICRKYPDDGTLILVDKEALGFNLRAELARHGIDAPFIYGKTPKKKRNETLRAYERREFKVLIGGKIIDRGLDLDGGCENLIIATGGKLWSGFNQKIGRAVRHNSRGRGRVFDFFFRNNKYLYAHSRARLTSVVKMGYRATLVFPAGRVDGADFIKSRFRLTKKLLAGKPSK